ncbi:MAG: hypothetical protein HQK89_18320, partial [Nitrospirae bacterium]|nr:hypothetical protein [Nitrospirota bacterium]
MIIPKGNGKYLVTSEKGRPLINPYLTLEQAKKRLAQVERFKAITARESVPVHVIPVKNSTLVKMLLHDKQDRNLEVLEILLFFLSPRKKSNKRKKHKRLNRAKEKGKRQKNKNPLPPRGITFCD